MRDAAPVDTPRRRRWLLARIDCPCGQQVRSVSLDVQMHIARAPPALRRGAHELLFELFGPPAAGARPCARCPGRACRTPCRRSQARRSWISRAVPLRLRGARREYLDALADGEVPLELLFSGTLFYAGESGQLQAGRISWDGDAEYRMPVRAWRDTIDLTSPAAPGCGSTRRASTASAPTGLATRSRPGRQRRPLLEDAAPGRGPRDRRRGALRGLPAVALPRRRPRTSAAGPSAASTREAHAEAIPTTAGHAHRVPARGPRDCTVKSVRFLHVVGGRCARRRAGRRAARRRRAPPLLGRGDRARADGGAARAACRSRSRPGTRRSRRGGDCARLGVARGQRRGAVRAVGAGFGWSPSRSSNTTPSEGAGARGGVAAEVLLHSRDPAARDGPSSPTPSRRRGCASRPRRAATTAPGRCWSTPRRTLLPRRSSSTTIRGSRRRARATCSTAARSMRTPSPTEPSSRNEWPEYPGAGHALVRAKSVLGGLHHEYSI